MSETPAPEDSADASDALGTLLANMAKAVQGERRSSPGYQSMDAADTIHQLVRRLEHATSEAIMDAYDVLTDKFGLEDKRPLYDYLFEVPMRFRLYREAFNAETHVGCVDRAVAAIAEEIQAAGNPAEPKTEPRFGKAALAGDGAGGHIGAAAAADALILADLFDDSRRIQRLSCDTREITGRILAKSPDVDPAKLAGTVRLILSTAADIAREQDGLETR
ncbi:hypothetical protein [Arthrobacter caoxuetaonis]|uniref:Uncharacterized protein n=1 Tax=Arthrobacter caoxuetaonis TaxID=2886935 RepID=A0A9X1MIT4_9MICC|nr:hypothetical protein [Arthrobacter caoxuetaonis]MCC3299722.1 hypothetical protein [Arthrobacter caoxuetaonis]USQ59376.1 hypothetical protein NF551_17665 [Arthrobacter caoxuetaonis]